MSYTHGHSVFQSLRGSQREKMLSVSRQVSSMRVGNLTFNHGTDLSCSPATPDKRDELDTMDITVLNILMILITIQILFTQNKTLYKN